MKRQWTRPAGALALCCLAAAGPAGAAEAALTVPLVGGPPALSDFEGMRPATALARSMARIDGFVQREPDDGEAASQRTEVYLGYDRERLYAVFLAFDEAAELIRANMSSRENIDGDDLVELTIDTFNDQRAAFSFRSTPLGIQWDARWTEGASRRAGFDTTLEAVWDSEGVVTERGYMARMAIPLRSLRFPDDSEQRWRAQFGRHIPRLAESSYWPAYSIAIDGRLNQTALLEGIRDVSPGDNFQLIPFLFAREADSLDRGAAGGPAFRALSEREAGLDAKFVFNDSMVLDLTLNPDFSQVESDEPQVTVNERFEVQFPERRPFFVENADFFATDSTLVFTRRIVDPEGGLRFTGRSGGYGFGAILINDEAPGQGRPAGDPLAGEKAGIAILRGFRDISEQDRVGFLATARELGDGRNRVASVDGRFRLDGNWSTQMQVVGTETRPAGGGASRTGYQRNIQVNRVGRTLNTHSHFIEASTGFRTDLGFQQRYFRADTSGFHQRAALNFYPEHPAIDSWSASLFGVHLEDSSGERIYTQFGPGLDMSFGTAGFEVAWNDYSETLRPGDFPGLAAARVYEYDSWEVGFDSNALESLEFGADYRSGTALNLVPPRGRLPSVAGVSRLDVDMLWRPFDRLRIANTYLRTELKSRGSGGRIFSNQILRSNWNYQFTRELSLRFIAQREKTEGGPLTRLEDSENLNFDLLLRYVINPWSAFYVGYNSNSSNFEIVEAEGERELLSTDELRRDGEQFFVKFSYLFQR